MVRAVAVGVCVVADASARAAARARGFLLVRGCGAEDELESLRVGDPGLAQVERGDRVVGPVVHDQLPGAAIEHRGPVVVPVPRERAVLRGIGVHADALDAHTPDLSRIGLDHHDAADRFVGDEQQPSGAHRQVSAHGDAPAIPADVSDGCDLQGPIGARVDARNPVVGLRVAVGAQHIHLREQRVARDPGHRPRGIPPGVKHRPDDLRGDRAPGVDVVQVDVNQHRALHAAHIPVHDRERVEGVDDGERADAAADRLVVEAVAHMDRAVVHHRRARVADIVDREQLRVGRVDAPQAQQVLGTRSRRGCCRDGTRDHTSDGDSIHPRPPVFATRGSARSLPPYGTTRGLRRLNSATRFAAPPSRAGLGSVRSPGCTGLEGFPGRSRTTGSREIPARAVRAHLRSGWTGGETPLPSKHDLGPQTPP